MYVIKFCQPFIQFNTVIDFFCIPNIGTICIFIYYGYISTLFHFHFIDNKLFYVLQNVCSLQYSSYYYFLFYYIIVK